MREIDCLEHNIDDSGADPWTRMILDYRRTINILQEIDSIDDFTPEGVVIGGMPTMANPKEKIEYAFNLVLNLMEEIEDGLSNRTTDANFLWLWGEFQKGAAILSSTIPELLMDRGRRAHNEGESKEAHRQWYAAWYEYYMALDHPKKNRLEKHLNDTLKIF